MVSGIYAAIFVVFHTVLTAMVGFERKSKGISLGDGGDQALLMKIRAHGNFVEMVPAALLLILIAELSGAPYWALYCLGGALFVGRVLHAVGMIKGLEGLVFREIGMFLTVLPMVLSGALCLWLSLPVLLSA